MAKGDKKAAETALTVYEKIGGDDPATLKKLAALEEELGQPKEAAATLDRINYIYPVHDEDLHRHLGDLWFAQANYPGAIREYTALVALNPLDKAGAHFKLGPGVLRVGTARQSRGKRARRVGSRAGVSPGAEVAVGD